MSAPMRPLRMSISAVKNSSSARVTAGSPCVSTVATMPSIRIPSSPTRRMANRAGCSASVARRTRANRALYPSSPTDRRRFSDARSQARCMAAPASAGSSAPAIASAMSSRARSRAAEGCGPVMLAIVRATNPYSPKECAPKRVRAQRTGLGPLEACSAFVASEVPASTVTPKFCGRRICAALMLLAR